MSGPWDDYKDLTSSDSEKPWEQFGGKSEEKPSGAIRKLADKALGFAGGAVGATKALADAAGAGNSVSNALESANNTINDYLTPEEKASQQVQSERTEQAKGTGVWNEFKTGVQNFAESPVQQTVSGLGSVVPVALAAVGGLPAAVATGVGMGLGTVKGRIFDDTKKRGIDAGMSPADAEAAATKAQNYAGENADQIALGGALGAADSMTGVGRIAGGMLRNAVVKPAISALPKAVERGVVGRAAMGALEEVPLEAMQGGQEQLATNIAAQRQGVDVDTWSGVAGQATAEGLASLGSGAGFGVANKTSAQSPAAPPAVAPEQQPTPPNLSLDPQNLATVQSEELGNPDVPQTTAPDGRAILNAQQEQQRLQQDAQIAANRAVTGPDDEILASTGAVDRVRKPSEAMGLDPAAGPMSAAAVVAVDTGVHQANIDQAQADADQAAYDSYIAQQDAEAQQQDTADKPLTRGPLAEAAMSDDDKRAVLFSNQSVADGGRRYTGTQDGDILNGTGSPFSTYLAAGRRANMEGKDWIPVKIGDKQFVTRRKDANVSTSDRVQSIPETSSGNDGTQPTSGVGSGATDSNGMGANGAGLENGSVGQSGELPRKSVIRPVGNAQPTTLGRQTNASAGPGFTAKDVQGVQNNPPAAAGTQAKAAPVETPAPAPGNATAPNAVPGAGSAAVQADGVTGFDSAAWNKKRDDTIKASRAAGNVHLDKVPPYVETMRGKKIYSAHDPRERGVIRTVDNNGNVYVDWSDKYSADKNSASPSFEGKKQVFRTSLGTTDLMDYVFGEGSGVSQPTQEPKDASAAKKPNFIKAARDKRALLDQENARLAAENKPVKKSVIKPKEQPSAQTTEAKQAKPQQQEAPAAAGIKAPALANTAPVATESVAKAERQYHLAAVNEKTGAKAILTRTPVTHAEAVTMKGKYDDKPGRRIQLEDVTPAQPAAQEPTNGKAKETDKGVAMYSRADGYNEAVDSAIAAAVRGDDPGRGHVSVGETSGALVAAGIPNQPLRTSGAILAKAHFDHGVTKAMLKAIPDLIDSPTMVFKSDTVPGSYVVITKEWVGDKPLMVAIKPTQDLQGKGFNFVPSAYPRNQVQAIQGWIDKGLLVYIDTKQSPQWFDSAGLQLPRDLRTTKGLQAKNIASEADIVKESRAPYDTPSTVQEVQKAIRQLIGITGRNKLGGTVATTAAEIKSTWEPLTGQNVNIESEGDAGRAQAYFDPKTNTVFLIADHIRAGTEMAVAAHELMHKHGQTVLGKDGWNKLHSVISTWANADPESDERLIYNYAASKVRAVGESLSSQELFPYAIEGALKAGYKPNAMARQGTVQKWLASVIQSMKDVWAKVTGKPDAFKVQDMVNLAFGIAQREHSLGEEAIGPEDFGDGPSARTQLLRNAASSMSSNKQWLDSLDAETVAVVKKTMLRLSQNREVLNSVIKLIPVDVMNNLTRQKLTPEMLFHDPSMLQNSSSASSGNKTVTLPVDTVVAVVNAAAQVAAKRPSIFGPENRGRPSEEGGVTDRTRTNGAQLFDDSGAPIKNSSATTAAEDVGRSKNLGRLFGNRDTALGTLDDRHVVTPTSDDVLGAVGGETPSAPPTVSKNSIGVKRSTAPDSGGAPMMSMADTLTSAANSVRDVNLAAGYKVADLINSVPGKLNWWHKTVGTQYNLAQRSKPFKRVYDAVQNFMDDVSYFATEAADLAPNILPKLESWKDMGKSPLSAEDTKALGTPVFEGTLIWARDEAGKPVKMEKLETAAAKLTAEQKAQSLLRGDHLSEQVLKKWQGLPIDQYEAMIEGKYERDMLKAGIVFTPAELKSLFNLNDKQVSLYQEFRKATDKSLTNLAIADMLRFGGDDVKPIRDTVLGSKTVTEAAETLRDYLLSLAEGDPARNDVLTDTANKMIDKGDKAQDLMNRGYAPLSRFGTYTLDVVDANGERAYFGLFESAADASRMRRKMEGLHPGATVSQGTLSEQAYKLFAGVSPETLELFGDMLGLEAQGDKESAKAFQEYLKLAKSNRSAMKRLIQRKGIAGFSEDAGRVLAGFVYSNARQTAGSLNMGEMTNAAADKDAFGNQGELQDAAVKLVDYIKNPQEEAQALRGLMFAQYIGGSVASAMVNMTQPITMTFPWLAQYGGAGKAAKQMTAAMKDSGKKTTGDTKLDAALHRAEEDGTVSPQEVHQLMKQAQGQGALRSGDGTRAGDALATAHNAMSRVGLAWGKLFSVAEQFNRRVTFIAAYRTAVEQGMPDPDGFARRAIHETQGVYNKGNKPAWARGAVGSTLFTFKQYSIAYVEMLSRMAKNGPEGKKAALLALGVLFLLSGAGGMPGADDLDDVISGAMQALGYNFDSKMKRKEFFVSLLGEGGAQFMERGVSGLPGVPIDVSGRMGLGNLIPGTGLFTKKTDHARDIAEIAGPVGDFAKRGFDAAGKLITWDVAGAANSMVPKAIQNLTQAYDMANMGMYRDQTGKKVIDTDGYDAISKAIGFQPNDVKRVQDASQEAVRMIGLNKINETKIADQWAQGVFEKNPDKIQSARDDLAEWNRDNPESPIRINFNQIAKRVRQMNMTKAERVAKTAPKEIRATVRQELESAR